MSLVKEMTEKYNKYWLNELPSTEIEALEAEYFLDSAVFESVLAAKEQLIHDYCCQRLSTEQRRNFESHFLSSPGHLAELKFHQALLSLQPGSMGESQADATIAAPASPKAWPQWFQAFSSFSWGSRLAIVSAALLVALSFATLVYWRSSQVSSDPERLLGTVASGLPEQMLALSPIDAKRSARSANDAPEALISFEAKTKSLRLQLTLPASVTQKTGVVQLFDRESHRLIGQSAQLTLQPAKPQDIFVSQKSLPIGDYEVVLLEADASELGKKIAQYQFIVR